MYSKHEIVFRFFRQIPVTAIALQKRITLTILWKPRSKEVLVIYCYLTCIPWTPPEELLQMFHSSLLPYHLRFRLIKYPIESLRLSTVRFQRSFYRVPSGKVGGKRPRGRSLMSWYDQIKTTFDSNMNVAVHCGEERNEWVEPSPNKNSP